MHEEGGGLKQPRPFPFLSFTGVRGRRILRSPDSGSCIDPPLRATRMTSKALLAAWRRSTCCGGGWICREMYAPVLLGLCAWTGVFLSV
jgi:hypothetical protein